MSRDITAGSADQSTVIRIIDSGDGTPEQGVTKDTTGLAMWYRREGAVKTAISVGTDLATLDAAHADGGILHIDDGYYRLDVPDAAFAASAAGVIVGGAVTDMIVIAAYHPLFDAIFDATDETGIADVKTIMQAETH